MIYVREIEPRQVPGKKLVMVHKMRQPVSLDASLRCVPIRTQSALIEHEYHKNKTHSSCEIEDFVETHTCKLCVILRSRVLRRVS